MDDAGRTERRQHRRRSIAYRRSTDLYLKIHRWLRASPLARLRDGLAAASGAQLVEDVGDVRLGGVEADHQRVGDRFVAGAAARADAALPARGGSACRGWWRPRALQCWLAILIDRGRAAAARPLRYGSGARRRAGAAGPRPARPGSKARLVSRAVSAHQARRRTNASAASGRLARRAL